MKTKKRISKKRYEQFRERFWCLMITIGAVTFFYKDIDPQTCQAIGIAGIIFASLVFLFEEFFVSSILLE